MADKESKKKSQTFEETPDTGTEKSSEIHDAEEIKEQGNEEVLETVLKSDFDALKDQSLRLAAEYDNFKKRTAKEKEGIYQVAVADIIKSLLPALDAIDSAVAILKPEQIEENKGFLSVFQLISDAVTKLGVETVYESEVPFDPNIHNAVMMEEGNGEHKIAQVFQKGYKYKDKVIRTAMVKVTANQ